MKEQCYCSLCLKRSGKEPSEWTDTTEEYLIKIRNMVGKDTLITVPNTENYRVVLLKLNDSLTKLKV